MAERNSFTRQFKLAVAAALLPLLAACAGPAPDIRAAVEVKLLAFNDFHGYLRTHSPISRDSGSRVRRVE